MACHSEVLLLPDLYETLGSVPSIEKKAKQNKTWIYTYHMTISSVIFTFKTNKVYYMPMWRPVYKYSVQLLVLFCVLGLKPKVLYMLSKYSTTELNLQAHNSLFIQRSTLALYLDVCTLLQVKFAQ